MRGPRRPVQGHQVRRRHRQPPGRPRRRRAGVTGPPARQGHPPPVPAVHRARRADRGRADPGHRAGRPQHARPARRVPGRRAPGRAAGRAAGLPARGGGGAGPDEPGARVAAPRRQAAQPLPGRPPRQGRRLRPGQQPRRAARQHAVQRQPGGGHPAVRRPGDLPGPHQSLQRPVQPGRHLLRAAHRGAALLGPQLPPTGPGPPARRGGPVAPAGERPPGHGQGPLQGAAPALLLLHRLHQRPGRPGPRPQAQGRAARPRHHRRPGGRQEVRGHGHHRGRPLRGPGPDRSTPQGGRRRRPVRGPRLRPGPPVRLQVPQVPAAPA